MTPPRSLPCVSFRCGKRLALVFRALLLSIRCAAFGSAIWGGSEGMKGGEVAGCCFLRTTRSGLSLRPLLRLAGGSGTGDDMGRNDNDDGLWVDNGDDNTLPPSLQRSVEEVCFLAVCTCSAQAHACDTRSIRMLSSQYTNKECLQAPPLVLSSGVRGRCWQRTDRPVSWAPQIRPEKLWR